jgi:putative transposase
MRFDPRGVHRPPPLKSDDDLALMRRLDEPFTAWPFLGWSDMP